MGGRWRLNLSTRYVEAYPSNRNPLELRNAVAFAKGTRYDPSEAAYDVDARGFAAYELWSEALESDRKAVAHIEAALTILD